MRHTYIYLLSGLFILSALALFVGGGSGLRAEEDGSPWSTRCADGAVVGDIRSGNCEIYQRLVVKGTNKRLVEFAVGFPGGRADARGIVVLPLGILLEPGVEMKIDDYQSFKFNVRYCDESGCFAHVNLGSTVLDLLRKGDNAKIIFQSATAQKIELDISLRGFTKALEGVY